MSNDIFPTLMGAGIEIYKSAEFKTSIFTANSGRETRIPRRQYPLFKFGIPIEFLLTKDYQDDYESVMAFFIARRGAYESFLYSDTQGKKPDNSVTVQEIGTGDGAETDYQLTRTWFGLTEDVNNPGVIALFLDEVEVDSADYTVSDTGLVTFATAPGNDAVITWTGTFYYRVRFDEDTYKFTQGSGIHQTCDDLTFTGSVRNIL